MEDKITISVTFEQWLRFAKYYYGDQILNIPEFRLREAFLEYGESAAKSLIFDQYSDYRDIVASVLIDSGMMPRP